MGGPGSGERWHKKGVVEDHYRLDVRELHREHEIKPGDRMTVQYERHGEKLIQQVYFDWTPCNFGGQRPWFICGDCGQRAAIIFGKGKDFACRQCKGLTYRSCQESDTRFSKLFRNYEGSGGVEDMPLYALKRFFSRAQKEKKRLIKELNRRPRGRPPKRAQGAAENAQYGPSLAPAGAPASTLQFRGLPRPANLPRS